MSKIKKTIQKLVEFNKWRSGDESIDMPNPREIGKTIDTAIRLLRKMDKKTVDEQSNF